MVKSLNCLALKTHMESLKGVNGLGARPMTHLQAIMYHQSLRLTPRSLPTLSSPFHIGMLSQQLKAIPLLLLTTVSAAFGRPQQAPLTDSQASHVAENVTTELFNDLEELSRIVDIAYCVGTAGLGIQKPFLCASRCQDFKHFELIKVSFRVAHCSFRAHI